ncbi:3981_t:CDS:2, partial [Dentiscutata erythropus]
LSQTEETSDIEIQNMAKKKEKEERKLLDNEDIHSVYSVGSEEFEHAEWRKNEELKKILDLEFQNDNKETFKLEEKVLNRQTKKEVVRVTPPGFTAEQLKNRGEHVVRVIGIPPEMTPVELYNGLN